MSFPADPVPLRVKPSRHFPFVARHPWVHAHALAEDGRDLKCGQVVDILDHDGQWLARGLINPASRLRIRLLSFAIDQPVDENLVLQQIDAAIARRRLQGPVQADGAERFIFSEADLLSGLIVDRYASYLAVQFASAAMMRFREPILAHLKSTLAATAINIRVDERTAKNEGIEPENQWHGQAPDDPKVTYNANGLTFAVDLHGGQKTGGYLDQIDNQAAVAKYSKGKRVLDVCCYAGGFALTAAKNGADRVVGIDSSALALSEAAANAERNGVTNLEFIQNDCFDALKDLATAGETFDVIVLDPPRFAGSRHQIDSALRAYCRLNSMAVDLLPPGGILVTCSCSGRVTRSDFLNMLADVARRRRRDMIVMENRGASADHPMSISCPESDYLKCVIAQVG